MALQLLKKNNLKALLDIDLAGYKNYYCTI